MTPDFGQIQIMQYVHDLENKVRKYQREWIRVSRLIFWSGFLAGSIVMNVIWWVMRWLKG